MEDIGFLILLGLVCVGIGFALGNLMGSAQGSKTRTENKSAPVDPTLVEVLRLWYDRSHGKMQVEMGGRRFRTVNELGSNRRDALLRALTELRSWANASYAAPSEPAHPPPAAVSASMPAASHSPYPVTPPPEPPKAPGLGPVSILASAVRLNKPVPEARSIASQVDEILQARLESGHDLPAALQGKAVRLMEIPGKGMVVLVGLDQYEGVDAVPDPEVQSLIHSCVAEWERSLEV